MQAGQEAGGVVDILVRIEHFVHAAEVFGVVVVVDLHATEIDQCLAFALRGRERGKGLAAAFWKDCFSFYIHSVRLQAAFFPRFSKSDCVEDTSRNAVTVRRPQDFRFTSVGGRMGIRRDDAR